jgi:hypothetical protein
MMTVLGIVLTILIALLIGVISGVITLYVIWLAIGALGIFGGFLLGSLIYELTLLNFKFAHTWGFMLLSVFGVLLGILLSCKYAKEVILISTSIIGGYLAMRGTSLFFPNSFPSERALIEQIKDKSSEIILDWRFWVYISEWVLLFAGFMIFQCVRYLHRPISAKETVNTSLN